MFPRYRNNYFCMFGCGVFKYRNDLLHHLKTHDAAPLKKFGFSKPMIEFQCKSLSTKEDKGGERSVSNSKKPKTP